MRSLRPTSDATPGCALALSETSSASTCSVFTSGTAHALAQARQARSVRYRPMLWIKALHVIFVVSWFAGLFYLPRLFVYHSQATDGISRERFKVMERKLYRGIMTPAMVLTLLSGLWL